MQYPQNNSDPSHRSSLPPGSPWRGAHIPVESPQQLRGPGPQSQFGQGQSVKLPSLPRLGASSQHTQSAAQQRPPHQPSFAQMIQAQPPNSIGTPNQAGKGPATRIKYSTGAQSSSGSGNSNGSGSRETTKETGAQILGSVNAHTMPRVNTSYGMSSLNTVLPGMNSAADGSNRSKSVAGTQSKQQQQHGDNLQQSTALMDNLSIQDRRRPTSAGPNGGPSGGPNGAASGGSSGGSSGATQTAAQRQGGADSERYGLRSLLDVMESRDKEKQSVILGSDMSQSGLNLNTMGEQLSHRFASPWQETSNHPVIPDFKLPSCYYIDTVIPQQQKLQNFDEGALFYIFYTMPRDALQEAAAVELTNRSWRYHKELKMWLTKDPMSEPIQTNNQEESGIYIFFDPTTWKKIKQEYILYYPDIA